MNFFLRLFPLLPLVASCQQSEKQVNLPLEDSIIAWLTQNKVPAVAKGKIEQGKIKAIKVFGNLEEGRPAPANTIWNVASLTKPVVAMVTLKLVNEGKWNLDEPLSNYWIDPDIRDDIRHKKLTTRIVLSHQTGFPNWRYSNPLNKLAFEFDPGSKFGYSGEGLEYLKKALENKTGQSIESLSKKYLFDPLQMNDTRYTWNDSIDHRFAKWHDKTLKIYATLKRNDANAADDLMTSVEDYTKFGVYVLKKAGLKNELYQEMTKTQVNVKKHIDYGLGWMIIRDLEDGEYALMHSGSDMGVRAIIILFPKSQRGLIVMTNGDGGQPVINNIIINSLNAGARMVKYASD